jgi:macrolide-specific efflux system membrane fusion protein
VIKDDGTTETRDVTVGVTDRVTAEILSGLAEGETVVVGTQTASANAARPARPPARPATIGGPPGVPGLGAFR